MKKVSYRFRQSKMKGGERVMRRVFLTVLVMIIAVAMSYSFAFAISGQCSNCHTMHNSQNGTAVVSGGPYERLLKGDCASCHTESTAATGAPVVYHDSTTPTGQGAAGGTLAGGDFYWVVNQATYGDAYGHNVSELVGADGNIGTTPPGWDQAATTGLTFNGKTLQVTGGTGWTGNQLTCAGTFGCHGYRDAAGIGGLTGAHHSNLGTGAQNDNPTDLGSSYRFLAGIRGLEDSDWQQTESSTDHNEYFGVDDTSARNGTSTYSNTSTISFLCAECHGQFHSAINNNDPAASPWIRHPTDIVLPNSGEYANYTTYSTQAPVARPAVPATASATVTPGDSTTATGAIVMCLSCHRPHGSDQPDLLRWDYTTMIAGGGGSGGCFTCHTTKN